MNLITFSFHPFQHFGIGLWPKEYKNRDCLINYGHWSVSDLAGCQSLCEAIPTCIGISYSHDGTHCRTCTDDILGSFSDYNFHRRPGRSIPSSALD